MNTKNIITGLLIVFLLVGLMLWGRSNQPTGPSQSAGGGKSSLVATETFYDFGKISMKDGLVNYIFKISNPTDKDILLSTVLTSCMCTVAYIESPTGEKGPFGMPGMGHIPPANEIIKAGERRDIKVVYDPNAHGPAGVGPVDRVIDLTEADGGTLRLRIKAMVTP